MGHDHALVGRSDPIGDIELVGFGIVEAGNLFGEQVDEERIEIEAFGYQAKCFCTFR
jgi:hypothetical protein